METTAQDQARAECEQIAKEIFAKFDTDHNGSIDKEEAKAIFMHELKQTGQAKIVFNEKMFEDWFSKADANHDG